VNIVTTVTGQMADNVGYEDKGNPNSLNSY
jgi:hypothetical protein